MRPGRSWRGCLRNEARERQHREGSLKEFVGAWRSFVGLEPRDSSTLLQHPPTILHGAVDIVVQLINVGLAACTSFGASSRSPR
jgi:hypothetical protein